MYPLFALAKISRPRTRVRDLPATASGIQNVQGSYGVLLKFGKGFNNFRRLSAVPLKAQSFFTQKSIQLRPEGSPAPVFSTPPLDFAYLMANEKIHYFMIENE